MYKHVTQDNVNIPLAIIFWPEFGQLEGFQKEPNLYLTLLLILKNNQLIISCHSEDEYIPN